MSLKLNQLNLDFYGSMNTFKILVVSQKLIMYKKSRKFVTNNL